MQINATAANGVSVETGKIAEYASNIIAVMKEVPSVEFIIQCNDETKPIWSRLVTNPPGNMSILFDASCGKGIVSESFPTPFPTIPCGYAGGIGPKNIKDVLQGVQTAADGQTIWIDMESSLRSLVVGTDGNHEDVFSVDKCFRCIKAGVDAGLPTSRFTLLSI